MNGRVLDVIQLDDSSQTNLVYQFDKNYFSRERQRMKECRNLGLAYDPDYKLSTPVQSPEWKSGSSDRDEVFSVVKNGEESFIYTEDEGLGNIMTQTEMKAYVTGRRDARFGVTGKHWFYSGLALGAITGYAAKGSMYSLAVPPIFALSTQIPTVKIRKHHMSNPEYYQNNDYALGYGSQARSKHALEALKGSLLGSLVGIALYSIVGED